MKTANIADAGHPADAHALGRRIVRGMIVIIFFGLFMRLGAFLINWIISNIYGPGPVLDAFTSVYNKIIFLLFFSSALKIINPPFMPLFAEQLRTEGEQKAWDLASTVANLCLLAGIVAALVAFLFAPDMVGVLLPKFHPDTQRLATVLLRWMLPGLLIQMLAVQALGILNSYKVFSYPAAADALQKLVWMAGLAAALLVLRLPRAPQMAPHLIGATYLVSCIAQGAVLLVGLRGRFKFYRLSFPALRRGRLGAEALWLLAAGALFAAWLVALNWVSDHLGASLERADHDLLVIAGAIGVGCLYASSLWYRSRGRTGIMGRFAFLAAPLIVGVLFARFRDLGLSFFQTYTEQGQYGVIEIANKVAGFPSVLIAFSLSVAMFPFLCDMAAQKDDLRYAKIMTGSLRMIALLLLPLTAVTIVMAAPVMRLIFDRGTWTPQEIRTAGLALAILSTGLFFFAIENLLMQAFFSQQRTLLPTALGIVFAVLPVLALYVLIQRMGLESQSFLFVCIAYPASRAMKNLCLLFFVHQRTPLISGREFVLFFGRIAALCAGTAAAAWAVFTAVTRVLPPAPHDRRLWFEGAKCIQVGYPAAAGLAVFILLCLVLRVEEFRAITQWVRERGWKKNAGPSGAGGAGPE